MSDSVEALVVGSGFGGAICAAQLVGAGVRTVMLERGPWRDTLPVRGTGKVENMAPLPRGKHFYTHLVRNVQAHFSGRLRTPDMRLNRNGFYELFYDQRTLIACASGVGGGSHAYTALHHPPKDPRYWYDISERIDPDRFLAYYADFLQAMGSQQVTSGADIPNHASTLFSEPDPLGVTESTWNPYMGVLLPPSGTDPAAHLSVDSINSSPERKVSRFCNDGILGSYSGSKATLDCTHILPAIGKGLVVRDCSEALTLVSNPPGSERRYRVDFYDHRGRRYRFIEADHVFLGAGTLNTLKLLFRSREQAGTLSGMAALGRQFATNADSIGFWLKQTVNTDYSIGLPCLGSVSFRDGHDKAQFIVAGIQGLSEIPMPQPLRRYLSKCLFIIGMGEDNNNGYADWQRGRLRIRYSLTEQAIYAHIFSRFQEVIQHFQRPLYFSQRVATTVHPLGGAPISDDPGKGLLDGAGQLHEYPGLYVADATALPRSPGMPPSMAIAAWSYHVAEAFLMANGHKTEKSYPLSFSQPKAFTL